MYNATPFMHRYLYKDHTPDCILKCFSSNLGYANRTKTNTGLVVQTLYQNVTELIATEAGRAAATPIERLARTQSLFFYQIIRLFDGDVTLRTQGESDIPLLRTWLNELCEIRENLAELVNLDDNELRCRPPRAWNVSFSTHSRRIMY